MTKQLKRIIGNASATIPAYPPDAAEGFNPHFIPKSVFCTYTSLFWFKIANKLCGFRYYINISFYIDTQSLILN